MHVGFSASNGQGSAVHIVDWWQFKTFGFLLSVIPMDTIEEGDSFLCYSEDSSINDYPFDPHERRKKAVEMALGLGGLGFRLMERQILLGKPSIGGSKW